MKRKPAWERILLPLLTIGLSICSVPVFIKTQATEVDPVLRSEFEALKDDMYNGFETVNRAGIERHNKQNKTLFTHEQILKGRLPKPR